MRIVQRYGDIEHMAAHHTPRCVIIRGGDEYLNRLAARRHARQWLDTHPDSELIELEAKDSSQYDFEEATSPSLLSPSAASTTPSPTIAATSTAKPTDPSSSSATTGPPKAND